MQAHLAGRAYADPGGTRANLYLIALGETGVGKDAPLAAPPPARLVDVARLHVERWRNAAGSDRPELTVAEETPEAKCVFRSTADTLMLLRKRLADSELFTARALVVRANEKIAKLALVRAISENPEKPVVTAEGVNWASKFVMHVTKAMLHEAQFHVAEGKFDALVKRFLGLLAKHGGSYDRRRLIKNLHVDHVMFQRIVMTLLMCDLIVEDVESNRNHIYTLRNIG